MSKKAHTMRIDQDLIKEIENILVDLKPKESLTAFFERSAWERIEKLKKTNPDL